MEKINTIANKLKLYSAIAAGILATGKTAKASVIYTDVNPDVTKGANQSYSIDFNADGTVDLWIRQYTYDFNSGERDIEMWNSNYNTSFIKNTASPYPSIAKLNFNDPIDANQTFITNASWGYIGVINNNMAMTGYDNWTSNNTDKYVGMSFKIGNEIHYGWVWLSVASDMSSFTVKGYAYESTAGVAIKAGVINDTPAATSIAASDVADNGNSSDIHISFTKAVDETGISKYRIFVVPDELASTFNLASAQKISDGQYYEITPNGSDPDLTLPAGIYTSTGDDPVNGASYNLFVMSVAAAGYIDNLSQASNTLTLGEKAVPTSAISGITADDVADNNTSSDIRVTATRPSNETGIELYRVFAVAAADAASFNLSVAEASPIGRYYEITPDSIGEFFMLPDGLPTADGNDIVAGKEYKLFMMSVAAQGYANNLSEASNTIVLSRTAPAIQDVMASDEADNDNASDIRVSFPSAKDESGISKYRMFVVPAADAASFGLETAQAVSDGRYYEIIPAGGYLSLALPSDMTDVNGNAVTDAISYQIFVMSLGATGYLDNISVASNTVTLMLQAKAATAISVSDEGDSGNASDINVSFTKASDEKGISSYRIFVVPASDVNTFDLQMAQNPHSGTYYDIVPDGSDPSFRLPSDMMSTNGELVSNGGEYAIFVLSVASEGYTDNLSESSTSLSLSVATSTLTGSIIGNTDIYLSGNDLIIRNMPDNGTVELYNTAGIKLLTGNISKGDNRLDVSAVKDVFVVYISSQEKVQTKKFARE